MQILKTERCPERKLESIQKDDVKYRFSIFERKRNTRTRAITMEFSGAHHLALVQNGTPGCYFSRCVVFVSLSHESMPFGLSTLSLSVYISI